MQKTIADPKDFELIEKMARDGELATSANDFMARSANYKYTYNFSWLGRPIIQYPQDILAFQEIIWATRPTLIVETGIAHGGSLIFSASMLELCGGKGQVVGIDVDIRAHNRAEIESHPLFKRVTMLEGSSVDPTIVSRVKAIAKDHERIMVILDSNHTHDHVLAELTAYAPLVTMDCYLIVCDTVVNEMPEHLFANRPWNNKDNPKTAVRAFMAQTNEFESVAEYSEKLLVSVAGDGYLRRVKPSNR